MNTSLTQNKPSPVEIKRELQIRKASSSAKWFLENFYYIPVVGVGPALFELRDYQEEIMDKLVENELVVSLKARQIGMTTICVSYALWSCLFSDNKPWLLVSKNETGAIKMLGRAMYGYDRLPSWMKDRLPKVMTRTQTTVEFENGSRLEAIPSVASTGRGDSVYGAILDEFAFMDYANEVFAALEPLVYGRMIVISTANGMGNRFHEIWLDSERDDSAWEGIFYPWDVVPSRTQDWYDRKKLAFRGQEWLFFQEYPQDAEEAFAKSGRTVFGRDVLEYLTFEPPSTYYEWTGDGEFVETEDPSPFALRVWEEPYVHRDEEHEYVIQKPNYVIGVDVAEGLEHGDRTVVTVWNANTDEMVASMQSHFPLEDLDDYLYDLGALFYWALMVVERNNQGIAVLVGLQRSKYPRIYVAKSLAKTRRRRTLDIGWITSNKTKPKLITDMLAAFREQRPLIYDYAFMEEANTFVLDGRGGYNATSGNHDDFIMATMIGWQGVLEVGKYPIVWRDFKDKPLTFNDIFGIDNGGKRQNWQDVPVNSKPARAIRKSFIMHPKNIKNR